MSLSSQFVVLLFGAIAGCLVQSAEAADVCPVHVQEPLRYVEVFDGPVEEMATLVPDKAGKRSGYWLVGYVYDAGRSIVVRCKYADKQVVEVHLSTKVNRCAYEINTQKTLTLKCK